MGRPQVSFAKRQREQAKRERQQQKAEKRAQRKIAPDGEPEPEPEVVMERPEEDFPTAEETA